MSGTLKKMNNFKLCTTYQLIHLHELLYLAGVPELTHV